MGFRALESGRRSMRIKMLWLALISLLSGADVSVAESINVAVAANFTGTGKLLVQSFKRQFPQSEVNLLSGSSGKLYAQIVNGAPFDIFMSADQEKPRRLVSEKFALPGSQFSYASGVLVLWSAKSIAAGDIKQGLLSADVSHIALAQPHLAPYGRAAMQVLDALGLRRRLEHKIVYGENVSQAYQFVRSAAAGLGFIARSQLETLETVQPVEEARVWIIPAELYAPILQDAVLLTRAKNKRLALQFMQYLQSAQAQEIMQHAGYLIPRPSENTVKK